MKPKTYRSGDRFETGHHQEPAPYWGKPPREDPVLSPREVLHKRIRALRRSAPRGQPRKIAEVVLFSFYLGGMLRAYDFDEEKVKELCAPLAGAPLSELSRDQAKVILECTEEIADAHFEALRIESRECPRWHLWAVVGDMARVFEAIRRAPRR